MAVEEDVLNAAGRKTRKPPKPPKPSKIVIEVNGKPVKMEEKEATGLEIKQAAIAQGVNIQPNFVLQQELPNGSGKIVGDQDKVHLSKGMSFTAIAPDDNS